MPTPPQPRRSRRPIDPLDAPDLNAPELQPVRSAEGLVHPESRLNQYVHNEPQRESEGGGVPWSTPGEGGILRDNPFGASPVGGETPFFTGGGDGGASAFEDDTEGIPMGLPSLLDLPDVPDDVPAPAPVVAAAIDAPIDAPVEAHDERPQRISRDPSPDGLTTPQAFLVGLGTASAAWLLVIGGWMYITFR